MAIYISSFIWVGTYPMFSVGDLHGDAQSCQKILKSLGLMGDAGQLILMINDAEVLMIHLEIMIRGMNGGYRNH